MARFFGYAMMAVGALITFLSGACTLYFVSISLAPHGDVSMITWALVLGLPFILIGIALFFGGRAMAR